MVSVVSMVSKTVGGARGANALHHTPRRAAQRRCAARGASPRPCESTTRCSSARHVPEASQRVEAVAVVALGRRRLEVPRHQACARGGRAARVRLDRRTRRARRSRQSHPPSRRRRASPTEARDHQRAARAQRARPPRASAPTQRPVRRLEVGVVHLGRRRRRDASYVAGPTEACSCVAVVGEDVVPIRRRCRAPWAQLGPRRLGVRRAEQRKVAATQRVDRRWPRPRRAAAHAPGRRRRQRRSARSTSARCRRPPRKPRQISQAACGVATRRPRPAVLAALRRRAAAPMRSARRRGPARAHAPPAGAASPWPLPRAATNRATLVADGAACAARTPRGARPPSSRRDYERRAVGPGSASEDPPSKGPPALGSRARGRPTRRVAGRAAARGRGARRRLRAQQARAARAAREGAGVRRRRGRSGRLPRPACAPRAAAGRHGERRACSHSPAHTRTCPASCGVGGGAAAVGR